jgi:F0F1-type ATP synthase assembly protein I
MTQPLPEDKKKKPSDDSNGLYSALGTVGTLGFTMVLSTFAGLAIGIWLDKITGLKPWFTIGCLLFGIVAGFVKIYAEMKKKL